MKPSLVTLKAALERYDAAVGRGRDPTRADVLACARNAGFDMGRAAEDWARYQIAVGEARDMEPVEEPEPEQEGLFDG